MRLEPLRTLVLIVATALAGTGCPEAPGDDGGLADGGPETGADSGSPADGGSSQDDGGAGDGGERTDGGSPSDAGPVSDGGTPDGGGLPVGAGFGRYLPSRDVRATFVDGTTLYVGGLFDRIQVDVGPFATVRADTGSLVTDVPLAPQITGAVSDAAPLDDGGLLVVGSFTSVGPPALVGVAKLRADGTVDPTFVPTNTYGGVAVTADATTAYVARIGVGQGPTALLSAIDLDSGAGSAWPAVFTKAGPANTIINIRAMTTVGGRLFVAGDFNQVDGQPRPGVAAFDTQGNLDMTFAPVVAQLDVHALDVIGSTLLVGGEFVLDEGTADERVGLLGLDLDTGALTDWAPTLNPGPPNRVNALAVDGDQIFVGGSFLSVNGETRSTLVSVDAAGALTAWAWPLGSNPSFPNGPVIGTVTSLALSGGAVYAGGSIAFYDLDTGSTRSSNAFAADTTTGELLDWHPSPADGVNVVAPIGTHIGIGGYFRVMGGEVRHGAAALDLLTGALLDWDPLVDQTGNIAVYDIKPRGGQLLLAGYFGGADPAELIVADPVTGAVTDEVQIAGFQDASAGIFTRGSTEVAVVGDLTCLAGNTLIPANEPMPGKVVCLDDNDAVVFSVDADNYVWALAEIEGELAVGGSFTAVGGVATGPLVRLDASGQLVTWAPNLTPMEFDIGYGGVSSLATLDGVLYASGDILVDDVQKAIVSVNADASLGAFQVERAANERGVLKIEISGTELLAGSDGKVRVFSTDDAEPSWTWSLTEVALPYAVNKVGAFVIVGGSSFTGRHLNTSFVTP